MPVRTDFVVGCPARVEDLLRPVREAPDFLVVTAITGLPSRHRGDGGGHADWGKLDSGSDLRC